MRSWQNQLSSVKEVRAYGVEKEHAQRCRAHQRLVRDGGGLRYVRQCTVPGLVYSIAAALLIAAVYLVCTLGLKIETDRLVVLVYVFARLWPLFSGFQGRIQAINSCEPAYEKLQSAFAGDEAQSEPDAADADFSTWREAKF